MLSADASRFCRPEEDPFLLLESTLHAVQWILLRRRGLPLRRTWIEQPYGEEEITLLEEEVLPALQRCLMRIDEIDGELQAQQDAEAQLQCSQLEAERSAEMPLAGHAGSANPGTAPSLAPARPAR
ncbi:MAG: hypothetical protein R6W06_02385 [Prochlorococcaceae cyanobacterium]